MVDLDKWISDILNTDPAIFENAYWGTRPRIEDVLPKLIDLLLIIEDPYARGKILELIGESESMMVMPYLEKDCAHSDQRIRDWANGAIDALRNGVKWDKYPKYL